MTITLITFSQQRGILTDEEGIFLGLGWAGHGEGKNNPAMQDRRSLGPLPQGLYTVGEWHDDDTLGPLCARLTQVEGETYKRDGFYIHGPSRDPERWGQESKGCIVIPRLTRDIVATRKPTHIKVTP